jgi:ribosomal-protein-serine acetyltransferase
LAIVLPGSDDCVGEVRIHHLDWANARAELGLWLAPGVRGRGLAPRALRLTGAWLFDAIGMERIQLLTEPDNQPMIAAARSAGFEYEGILRGYTRERGKRVDVAVFSLLPADLRR